MAEGFAEEVLVDAFDFGVVVGAADFGVSVDFVKSVESGADGVGVGVEGLSTAGDAAAGAGHDFDEVEVGSAIFDVVEYFSDVGESADDGDADVEAGDV